MTVPEARLARSLQWHVNKVVCDGVGSKKGSYSIILLKLKASGKIGYGSNRSCYIAVVNHDDGTMHQRHADKRWIKG
jgi:hypothetical protein